MIFEPVGGRIGTAMLRRRPALRFALNARPTASQDEAPARATPQHGIRGKKTETEKYRHSTSRILPSPETTFTQNS